MIQKARKNNSRSLLREAQSAILLIEDPGVKDYFLNSIKRMIEKRNTVTRTVTGAKELKTQLLSYLSQIGEVKTANIWCRKIVYSEIKNFLENLKNILKNSKLQGVAELHLQDREINSPHIQYVGLNAEKAERVIGRYVAHIGYETSFESAIMINHIPAYETEERASLRVQSTDYEIRLQEKINYKEELKLNISKQLQELANMRYEFKNILSDVKVDFSYSMQLTKREMRIINRKKSTEDLMEEWRDRQIARSMR
ncbi:hypothetical protein A9K75_09225 [Campylobacter fetus subsp. testudinum]|uniref:hypothetical protein n=1 Tax=Campylobacter fetus TaxID=196 RepID=UPI0008187985|nr:hypothetical protein [Campylobacter fetus]OCR98944.1 hypothetical protein A9K75_09225 [Campylobacter fetus subsp. testudinum]